MTKEQFRTYFRHLLLARHYRGHGIHSPFLYAYIRGAVIRKGDIVILTREYFAGVCRVEVVGTVREAIESHEQVTVLPSPFSSRSESEMWKKCRAGGHFLSVHLPHHMVIFRKNGLQNQHFMVRR